MTTHVDVVVAFKKNIYILHKREISLINRSLTTELLLQDYSARNRIRTQTKLKQDKHTPNNTKPKRGIAETKQNTIGSLLTAMTPG